MRQICDVSILRGVEEWQMQLECAAALPDQKTLTLDAPDDGNLVPDLADMLYDEYQRNERQSKPASELPRRRSEVKSRQRASRFWDHTPKKRTKMLSSHSNAHVNNEHADEIKSTPETPSEVNGQRRKRHIERCLAGQDVNQTEEVAPYCSRVSSFALPQDVETKEEDVGQDMFVSESSFSPFSPCRQRQHAKAKSPYFADPSNIYPARKPRPLRGTVSGLPIPPLSASSFGLLQEELAMNPFQLMIGVTFLIRTAGHTAIPVFRELITRFPTPEDLAAANPETDIVPLIWNLGLGLVRCAAVQKYARGWVAKPPTKSIRYGVKNYPKDGDGQNVRAGQEFLGEEDEEEERQFQLDDQRDETGSDTRPKPPPGCAWEIGHLTQGRYSIDSWRIFCRDVLLGRAEDWKGHGRDEESFEPEWKRVLPVDKELRACLRWMWMREGWEWDPETGQRTPLREEMRIAVNEGKVEYDDLGRLVILEQRPDLLNLEA
jgi:hypothetical protein